MAPETITPGSVCAIDLAHSISVGFVPLSGQIPTEIGAGPVPGRCRTIANTVDVRRVNDE
jgi:hypothetical protein